MLKKQFTLALVSIAASAKQQWYGKHMIDYLHGAENADADYMKSLLAEREAMVARGENPEPLTIHLVPHTHDDIGWLKTIDEYYSGTDMSIAIANVSKILDTVIDALLLDETRVFTYVEMKFFSMWFYRQSEKKQDQVRQLVKNKQLEFMNAGWSMHDEACTHHDDMMNNMIIGHEFLLKEFDYVPTIGWHIDPFGHSNANPRLFADMGFDTFIFGRLDYEDREERLKDRTMQFVWKPFSESLGDSVEIFTHILQDMYWFPPDMGYDERDFQDVSQPIIDDETLSTFNADWKSERMAMYALHMAKHYRTKNMFMPWGEDFAYGNAFDDYENGDALIRYWKKTWTHLNIDMRYSTVYDYVNAVKAEEITWPTKYDDMFPYADWPDQYWSGYFTSRANSKSQVRFGQHNLHASEKLYTGKVLDQKATDAELESIKQARYTMFDSMGSYQHHDAVTGTGKQHVADDYSLLLSNSMATNNAEFEKQVADYTEKFAGIKSDSWAMCSSVNATYTDCPIAPDTSEFAVTSYNPAAIPVDVQTFKVPPSASYNVEVFDNDSSTWNEAESTLLCYDFLENNVEQSTYTDCNLHVKATAKPHHMTFMKLSASTEAQETPKADSDKIETSTASLTYTGQDEESGASKFTYATTDGQSYDFAFNLQYYNPSAGNAPNIATSGAYLFVPEILDQKSHLYSAFKSIEVHAGSLASEFALVYMDSKKEAVYQALIRLGEGFEPIEFEVQMLEIPLIDNKGREVVAKWTFDGIDNEDTFYTDSNGLEMQKRVKDYRPDFTLETKMKVNDNYYPINSAIAMRDLAKNVQVTVMNQHSQGGSSIETGSIELMQNRRLLHDDNKGVTDPLNEMQPDGRGIAVNTKYFVSFTDLSTQKSVQRKVQLLDDEPLQFFYTADFKQKEVESDNNSHWAGLGARASQMEEFKGDLKLQQFPEARNQVLIRLENLSDLFDGTPEETPTFDLQAYALSLYSSANEGATPASVTITERTLSNNQDMKTMLDNKFKWKSADSANPRLAQPYPEDPSATTVALQPQRIRLFRVQYTASSEDTQILTE